MQSLNVARGMFRIWTVLTALWMLGVAVFAWFDVSDAVGGRWQYAIEFKDHAKPWEKYDGRPMKDIVARPSEKKYPPAFSKVEWRYLNGFDESVVKGSLALIDFPDRSQLYIGTFFEKADQDVISQWYWDRRWTRKWEALVARWWLLLLAVVPPLVLLLIGFVVRWIWRGFRSA